MPIQVKGRFQSFTSVALIAFDLSLSEGRVRAIIRQLKMKPTDRIGNVPLYSYDQEKQIEARNKQVGRPKKGTNHARPHRTRSR